MPCAATEMIQDLDEKDPEYERNREVLQDVLGAVYAGEFLDTLRRQLINF